MNRTRSGIKLRSAVVLTAAALVVGAVPIEREARAASMPPTNHGDTSGSQQTTGHWDRNGATQTPVYFVDQTPANWPVGTALSVWNRAYPDYGIPLALYYRTSCTVDVDRCVYVRQTNSTAAMDAFCGPPEPGRVTAGCFRAWHFTAEPTHLAGVSPGEAATQGSSILVSTTVNNTAALRRATACHELGHAIGLGERGPGANTCMDDDTEVQLPDAHD